jgi:hypothetical protein
MGSNNKLTVEEPIVHERLKEVPKKDFIYWTATIISGSIKNELSCDPEMSCP